jgi:hypothetical protein
VQPPSQQQVTPDASQVKHFGAGVGLNVIGVFIFSIFHVNMVITLILLGVVVTLVTFAGGAWAILASDFVKMFLPLRQQLGLRASRGQPEPADEKWGQEDRSGHLHGQPTYMVRAWSRKSFPGSLPRLGSGAVGWMLLLIQKCRRGPSAQLEERKHGSPVGQLFIRIPDILNQ